MTPHDFNRRRALIVRRHKYWESIMNIDHSAKPKQDESPEQELDFEPPENR